MGNVILIILLVLLVILSAFFSMTEIAFSSANKFKLKANYERNPKKYKLAYLADNNFTNTISTILVGNNLVNIAASSASLILALRLIQKESTATLLSTILLTLIILIFGEILPKLIGARYANSLVVFLSYPFKFFDILFKPVTFVVNKFVNLLSKLWTPKEKEPSLTDEELIDIVEDLEENDEIDEDKSELIINAIEFKDTSAYDIIIPRIEIVGFDINEPISNFSKDKELLSRSRIVVYNETLDDILGYVDIKDIMKNIYLKKKFNVKDYLHEVYYVNETKKIDDLYREMNNEKTDIVVVVDEFGGTDGIITREDIFEELVGEIWDEKDKVEYDYKKINDKEYIVDGDMDIYDFFDMLEVDRDDFESEYTTVSGYMSEVLDKIPEKGDSITYKNLRLTVLKSDETSALKIKVIILENSID